VRTISAASAVLHSTKAVISQQLRDDFALERSVSTIKAREFDMCAPHIEAISGDVNSSQ
jgi:hypothetical protein